MQSNLHFWIVVFCLSLSIMFCSCRKLVQDDFPDFTKVPVINSILVADSLMTVHVSLTDKIGDEKLSFTDNAQVIVTSNNDAFDTLSYIGNSVYQSKTTIKPLENYECRVTIPGYQTIVCNNLIPDIPEILDIEHINNAGRDEEGSTYPAIKITFKNNPQEHQYFQIAIKLVKYDDDVEPAQIIFITDAVLLNEGIPLTVFSNELIESDSYTMTINYTSGIGNNGGGWHTELDPLVIELRAISYDYYMYLKQLYLYETGRYPTDVGGGAVTNFNLYSNIPDGYGIFAGYSAVVYDTIFP